MLFIGYATQHEGDCWRMYNPETRRVSQTWDVIWLNSMYYEKPNAKTMHTNEACTDRRPKQVSETPR